MKKYLLFSFMLMLAFAFSDSWAQERSVSGKVTSVDEGEALPGVNVVLKGTTTGTVTDIDGNYKVNVPESGGTLIFSFIGLASQEVDIGSRTVIDVQMSSDIEQLSEVVVTANAIQREKRTLGYSVSSLGGEELNRAREVNVVNSLSGKVAGVQVTGTGGGLGQSSRILIRGNKSLTGSNQPLFVVDGVPVFNSNVLTGDDIQGAFDVGNGAGEINPNDIESVTVLKGANAAALYGSRARNGAIIITTKKGKKGKAAVSVNSSFRADTPLVLPDFQNSYTGGTNGRYINTFQDGWGERIEGQTRTNFQGLDETLTAQPDNYEDFFQTGKLWINSVSFSNGNENGDFRLGVTSLNQQGIVPSSELDRYTITANAGTKVGDKVNTRMSLSYIRSENVGQVASGGNTPLALVGTVQSLPRTQAIDALKFGGGNQDSTELLTNGYPRLSDFIDSPWYTAEQTQANQVVERVFGNAQADFQATEWLNLLGRVGIDNRVDQRNRVVAKGTLGAEAGSFTEDFIKQTQLTTSMMATMDFELNPEMSLSTIIGHEYNQRKLERLQNLAQGIEIPGLYTPTNASTNTVTNDFTLRRFHGVYADVTFSYKDWLTLNATGRNDWSSTLPEAERSYFYPSVSASFIFTDAFDLSNNIISFGKIRASWAQVGSDTNPYLLNFTFFPDDDIRGQFGQGNNFPFLGQPGFAATNTNPPLELTPEFTTSLELGADITLFNDKVDIDFTWYDITTTDQILQVPVAEATGFALQVANLGEIKNSGVELGITANPLTLGEFNWSTRVNFTMNNFEVVELGLGLEEVGLSASFSGFQVTAVPGADLELHGTTWLRDSVTGRPVVDPTTGLRQASGENTKIGDLNPDFLLGWSNTFSYKGITLSFLLDWKNGGDMLVGTTRTLRNSGLSEETLFNREGAIIDAEAVILDENGVARDNDIAVTPEQFWTNYSSSTVLESSIFDASFLKLRELSISYALPNSVIGNTPFKSVSVGIEGRNLALLWARTQHIDPEVSLFQAGDIGAGAEERFGVPSTRSVGFNVKLGF